MTDPGLETLRAFVDGELPADEANRVAALVSASERLQQQVRALRASALPYGELAASVPVPAALQSRFDALVAQDARAAPPRRGAAWRGGLAAAALAGFAVLGALWFTRPPADIRMMQALTRDIISYHQFYGRETVAGIEGGRARAEALLDQLAPRLPGARVVVPDLREQGFEFVRAQHLRYDDGPLLQFVYLGESSVPLAYCLTPSEGEDSAVAHLSERGLQGLSWREQGWTHVVVGDLDPASLEQTRTRIRAQL